MPLRTPAAAVVALAIAAAACQGARTGSTAAGAPPSTSTPPTTRATTATATATAVATQTPVPVESNPPGDIPDTVAYVPYRNQAGRYAFTHPEGWASVVHGATATFSDKLNGITATAAAAAAAPTVATARAEVPALTAGQPAFELRSVTPLTLPGGTGVLIVFRRNSDPDPVTGKVLRDEVNRYEVFRSGRRVTLDLYGPVGSDNVDPYRTISQSLRVG